MKKSIKKVLFSIFIFSIYFSFSYVISFFIDILNIDMANWKYVYKIIFIYLLDVIPLVFFILIYKKNLKEKFKDFKSNFESYLDKYIRIWLFGIFLMSFANVLISLVTKNDMSNNEEAIRNITDILPIYSIISTCICAPIIEELAYRKTIGDIFTNKKYLGIIIGGLMFGLAHVIGTYTSITDLLYIIPYGILGSAFMYIYYDSNNIFTTISLHFMHNTILLITYFISKIF